MSEDLLPGPALPHLFGHAPSLWAFVHIGNSAGADAGLQSLIGAYRAVGI